MNISDFLRAAQEISSIKKQEVPLPIAQKTAIVSPLKVGDDLALRTSLTSPVSYDREMSKLLYDHSEFVLSEGQTPTKETFEKFQATTSNVDKVCLLWAMYKTTYETLGPRPFKCEKENCKNAFKEEIMVDSLIQEDTFTPWEETLPFYDYIFPIECEYAESIFSFESKLPSIRDHNRLLSNLSIDTLQNNLSQTNSIFTRREQMTLINKSISIKRKGASSAEPIPRTENMQEMLIAFTEYIPYSVGEDFFQKYQDKFNRYYPKFYTMIKCPTCSAQIRFQIDLEIEFFRRSLFGQGASPEEL